MRVTDLDYDLPPELIAQEPAAVRDASRLLVLDRRSGAVSHSFVRDLPALLRAHDLLVVNDTRVIPARFFGHRPTGGRLEVLLVRAVGDLTWDVIVRGQPRVGEDVAFDGARGTWLASHGGGRWRLRFVVAEPFDVWLARVGEIPLPPYIRRPDGPTSRDAERYQTVFGRRPGAIAAPTAGLHLTPELLTRLPEHGVEYTAVTLHVGPGTFLPIRDGDLATYEMEAERYEIGADAVGHIARAQAAGGRVIAVGTTTTRTLESAAAERPLAAGSGEAGLFIRPGHAFRVVDGLFTNFHLPRTPLLALVAAFAGWEALRHAYETAVAERYRFYSYGDAMLVL